MKSKDLFEFVEKVFTAQRIGFADVRRLQRDILPNGITSRGEVELLLQLERVVTKVDRTFADWLVANVVDFVVWGARPTGTVDKEIAAWLMPLLQDGGRLSLRIAREVVLEAQQADPMLHALADPATSASARLPHAAMATAGQEAV